MRHPLLAVKHLFQHFEQEGRRVEVLRDITLEVHRGEFLMLVGPSGSGKSTLLRVLAGLLPPSRGYLMRQSGMKTSFIFQDFALFPWLTAYENIEFGLKMHGMPSRKRRVIVEREIEQMGLGGFEKNFPRELSGGMKQRVGIARALATGPDIIFLDEPFSALDSFTAARLRAELLEISRDKNLTVVMVTHLVEEAASMADRIIVLSSRPARIEAHFENKLPQPRNNRSSKFFSLVDDITKSIRL